MELSTEYLEQTRREADRVRQRMESRARQLENMTAEQQSDFKALQAFEAILALTGEAPHPNGSGPRESWAALARPLAVLKALSEAGKPIMPSEIARIMATHGKQETGTRQISSALVRLRERGRVKREAHGYVLVTERGNP